MQKVKLSDALTVSKIRTHLGVIEGIGWSGNQPYVSINGVDHRVFDDSLDWDRGEWSIVLPPGARYLAQVFVNGQTVCYEDIVHCIEERKVQAHEIASDKRSQRKESLMKEVKLADALEVTRITCSLDLNGQIKDDTLYWSGDGWYVRTINGMELKVYPKFNKEYVDYQEMVKLISVLHHYRDGDSKHKETEMENVFKLSEVIKVADVHVDGYRKVFSAYRWNNAWWLNSFNIKYQLSDGNIHWKEGEWVIEPLYTHQPNIRVTINYGTVKTPDQLFALLLPKDKSISTPPRRHQTYLKILM